MSEYQLEASQAKLPPGWDCKYDPNTGFYFYINYLTKKTTFEDPRLKYNTNQPSINTSINSNDTIPLQTMHGSPYHVYPMNNHPPMMQAFQGPPSVTTSPLLTTNRMHQPLEMMTPTNLTRPTTPRAQPSRTGNVQETSFSNPMDIEASITKVNTMFPTVPEPYIRTLFKKYHNREAVIISALQVEKHPLTTPGPYATPPMTQRNLQNGAGSVGIDYSSLLQNTICRGSPTIGRTASCASGSIYYGSPRIDGSSGYRQSPKPHSSPKMKLRYLKSIFPKAEETLILDVLGNHDNNVQQASEELLSFGYAKKDTTIPKMSMRKKDEDRNEIKHQQDRDNEAKAVPVPPKAVTEEEREALRQKIQSQYPSIAERIILMALESVDYCEDKALQILKIVVADKEKEDNQAKVAECQDTGLSAAQPPPTRSTSKGRLSTSSSKTTGLRLIVTASTPLENECAKFLASTTTTPSSCGPIDEDQPRRPLWRQKPMQKNMNPEDSAQDQLDTVIRNTSSIALGPNKQLSKGPNDELLLVDYVVWNGANPGLAKGSMKPGIEAEKRYVPKGANPELCKGPKAGLSKGSIYAKASPSLLWV